MFMVDVAGDGGGSDDDSVLYCLRNYGRGVPNTDHIDSIYDVDLDTGKRRVR